MSSSKGQINIEFLAAALLYLGALAALVLVGSGTVPEFTASMDRASLNLEARQISTKVLTTSGSYDFGSGGSNWQKNNTTIEHMDSFGLASDYLEIERDKLMDIRSFNPRRNDFNYFNYSQFKQVTDADNQYRFKFTWMPIAETHRSFTRGDPPSDPPIQEPSTSYYTSSGNRIHYGKKTLNGRDYHFLVTSHDGVYNTTYVSRNWDFEGFPPEGIGDTFSRYPDRSFTIENIQNRPEKPGAMLVLSQHLKTFGANVDTDSRVVSMNRYALMEGEPVKVRVLTW